LDISQEVLSDLTVHTKYARYEPTINRRETWAEIVDRNKNMHIKKFKHLGREFTNEIRQAYQFVHDKKVLPSMRSMQFAGKPIEISPNRIYNCGYLPIDDYRAFSEIMFLLLGGSGLGYSVQRHHIEALPPVIKPTKKRRYLISDSIEGWADAVKALMKAYLKGASKPDFDYSDIRPKGARLKTSGGIAPGPEPLKDCLHNVKKILDRKENGEQLSTLEVHDIICYIADAVLAGGIRRAALISLFSFDDEEMLSCKAGNFWELNPQRSRANNSVVTLRHRIRKKDFYSLWNRIKDGRSGEPGIYFTNDIEWGVNPCCEIGLRAFQFCNLCEVNVSDVQGQNDFNDRVAAAAFIGTLQASYTDFHYLREIWKRTTEKDALLGVGMTGIASGKVLELDLEEAAQVSKNTNAVFSKIIGIKKAARLTTVKPSGTASCVLGCSSGIHAWHSNYYIRRMRLMKNEALYLFLADHHPELVEDDVYSPTTQACVSLPQKAPDGSITRFEETALTLLERVKKVNVEWVKAGNRNGHNTHNVSATVTIKDDEWNEVRDWMWKNREFYNGLAILPFDDHAYVQAPFEDIDEQTYYNMINELREIDVTQIIEYKDNTDHKAEAACAGGACEIV